MAHSHSHSPSPGNDNAKRLMLAFGVTATFMVIEVIGGLISGSLALLADAGADPGSTANSDTRRTTLDFMRGELLPSRPSDAANT